MTNDQTSDRPQSLTSQRAPLRGRAYAALAFRITLLATVLVIPTTASAQAAASILPQRSTSNMPADTTVARGPHADIAPALDDITQRVLFGQVWERAGLSKRDRSLVTVATLIAQYRTNELPYHLKFAMENGVTKDELTELITHLAFYAGWPAANTAVGITRQVFAETAQ
jgi:4-carboxymuconolactone decarboxylase